MGRVLAHKAAGVLFVQNRLRSRNLSANQPLFLRNGTAAIVMHKALYGTAAMRKFRPLPRRVLNGSNRPLAAFQDRPCERAESARKRSSAEGVGCVLDAPRCYVAGKS